MRLLGTILFSLFWIDFFTGVFGFVAMCTWMVRQIFTLLV